MDCFLYNRCSHINCESDFCQRKFKLEKLYDLALLTQNQRKPVLLKLDQNNQLDTKDMAAYTRLKVISENMIQFVDEGRNLYLHSTISGNGKTSWCLKMIEKYFDKIWVRSDLVCRVLFISVPRLLISLKDNINNENQYAQHILENIDKADLVIWDDIASKIGSEYEINQLLNFIDNRISLGKSNIYTSNLNPTEMMKSLGSRLTSRICNMSEDIELYGVDKRNWSVEVK